MLELSNATLLLTGLFDMKYLMLLLVAGGVGFVGYEFAQNGYELDFSQGFQSLPPATSIVKQLETSEAMLNDVYEDLAYLTPEEAGEKSMRQLADIESNYKLLGQHTDVDTKVEREAQMIVMRSHFLASHMLPTLKEPFANQAKRVMTLRPDSDDAAIAKVLLFCTTHDLESPVDGDLLQEISTEARSFSSASHAVGLYSVVAHECWKNGHADAAEEILSVGIADFKDRPEKIRLVNQLIDQGHREPPKPKLTQAQYKRMQRAMEKALTGAAIQFRS